jgi:hypothetical protein
VHGLDADLSGFNEGSFTELPPQAETHDALLAIAQAVGSGGPPARLPFRLAPPTPRWPAGDTAWRMGVTHEGGARWSATLGLGLQHAAPSIWVTSRDDAFECPDPDTTGASGRKEPFTYRGFAGCLIKKTTSGPVMVVVLQVGAQQRVALMNLDADAPPAPLTDYAVDDLKRMLADLTVTSDDPDGWFDLPSALGAG